MKQKHDSCWKTIKNISIVRSYKGKKDEKPPDVAVCYTLLRWSSYIIVSFSQRARWVLCRKLPTWWSKIQAPLCRLHVWSNSDLQSFAGNPCHLELGRISFFKLQQFTKLVESYSSFILSWVLVWFFSVSPLLLGAPSLFHYLSRPDFFYNQIVYVCFAH